LHARLLLSSGDPGPRQAYNSPELDVDVERQTEREALRALIMESLAQQGFRIEDGHIHPPDDVSKSALRSLHSSAVKHAVERSKPGLVRHERRLLKRLTAGNDLEPESINPKLIEVKPGTENELLFRYVRLHWSIPVSAGYGRRLRFLVEDEHSGGLIGILGLGDPVYNLAARDLWIGWNAEQRRKGLAYIADAYVLGAVPPFSYLLCAKLVAMIALSNEVRMTYRAKYGDRKSVISGRSSSGQLAMITTTSALGRSSLYNRLQLRGQMLYVPVGYTQGYGDFHFSNGIYGQMKDYASKYCSATERHTDWGTGFRNRSEVVRKCLRDLGISGKWRVHGVERQVFVAKMAANASEFLCGQEYDLSPINLPMDGLFGFFRERWLLPRSERDTQYRSFRPEMYALWSTGVSS
jgi:hypothetical protein